MHKHGIEKNAKNTYYLLFYAYFYRNNMYIVSKLKHFCHSQFLRNGYVRPKTIFIFNISKPYLKEATLCLKKYLNS
jgi:hypothetical protein